MDHLTGIFWILFYGITFAISYETLRIVWTVHRRAAANNVSETIENHFQ